MNFMRKRNFFISKVKQQNHVLLALSMCFVLNVGLFSCKGDDDEPPVNPVEMVVSPTSLTLGIDETGEIAITEGNGGYKVSVTSADIASATLDGTTVTVKGLKEGSTSVVIKDNGKKSQTISVTVKGKAVSGTNNINTSVKYDMTVLSGEVGQGNGWNNVTQPVKGTTILTRRDFLNDVNTEDINGEALATVDEFFNGYCSDNDVFVCGGYWENGDLDMGYAAPALKLTDKDDSTNPGCKVVTVITSNLAAACQWAGYSSKSNSTAFYNPSDGSFTIKVSGYLGWGMTFTYHRKYTPAK
jgi:hypothetical protein